MIRLSAVALSAMALIASVSPAMSQSRVEVGVLECRGVHDIFYRRLRD